MTQQHGATLAGMDQALAAWRDRLAAASRNVAELSELPEYLALKAAARGDAPGTCAEARLLIATVDELWQGVLLLGEALGRAEAAREAATRSWMGFGSGSANAVGEILDGPSIGIRLGESPVLHRSLLGAVAETVWVSPGQLLQTMEAAFDSARAILARAGQAAAEAQQMRDSVQGSLQDARALLAEVERCRAHARDAASRAAACLVAALPAGPDAQTRELPGWLDRLQRVVDQGRSAAGKAGLANWTALAEELRTRWQQAEAEAHCAMAAREELRGRLGALQAKQAARADGINTQVLDAAAAAARASLFGTRADLAEAQRRVAAYEAALAGPVTRTR